MRNDPNATLLEALVDAGENVWRKIQLFAIGVLHLLFSSDKQWQRQLPSCDAGSKVLPSSSSSTRPAAEDTSADGQKPTQYTVKRIIFIRHAESEWNVVFNRGVYWQAVVQFFRACVREWLMLPTQNSIFIDSPLSRRGVRQAKALFEHVSDSTHDLECGITGATANGSAADAALLQYLIRPLPNSVIVTSNLRRSIDTARIASAARLELPGEKIHVLSSLQEIGRNIDTLTISDAYAIKPQALSSVLRLEKKHDDLFNLSESHGNKAVLGCGRQRLHAFAEWATKQQADVLVVYGHSLWFRSFCQEFFPSDVAHGAKTKKLANCGVVTFKLEQRVTPAVHNEFVVASTQHRIVPGSFHCVH
ncbi:Histidine phosphatase superfamily, clade-1, partial [Globisporangium splendens]